MNLRDFFTGNETIKSSQQAENDQISTIIQNSTWRKQDEQVTHTYYQERQTAFSVRQQLQAKKFQLPNEPSILTITIANGQIRSVNLALNHSPNTYLKGAPTNAPTERKNIFIVYRPAFLPSGLTVDPLKPYYTNL